MTVIINRGKDAWQQLSSPGFKEAWDALYLACPWAAPAQSSGFVMTWYEIYRHRYFPVLISECDDSGSLAGLLALAIPEGDGNLFMAGEPQGEYRAWIAFPETGNLFIRESLLALKKEFPRATLIFKYLPPNAPLDFLKQDNKLKRCSRLTAYRRPLMVINKNELANDFRKKHTRNRLNSLRRLGEVVFERVLDAKRADILLNEIMIQYDFRQGAINNISPFQNDPLKKEFQLALLKKSDTLHFTTLSVAGRVISAHLGLYNSNFVQGGMLTYSVFHSRFSPAMLHILMLATEMVKDNICLFDLTPGDYEWKERFANDYNEVFELTVYNSLLRKWMAGISLSSRTIVKKILAALGISSHSALLALQKANRLGFVGIAHKMKIAVAKRGKSILYRYDLEKSSQKITSDTMLRDYLKDLLAFVPAEPWEDRQEFLLNALRRIERGYHIYTHVAEGQLLCYGWLIDHPEAAIEPDIGRKYRIPEDSAWLLDCYTLPQVRGRGLFTECVKQMLRDVRGNPGTKYVCVSVRANNIKARHVVEKLGFDFYADYFNSK